MASLAEWTHDSQIDSKWQSRGAGRWHQPLPQERARIYLTHPLAVGQGCEGLPCDRSDDHSEQYNHHEPKDKIQGETQPFPGAVGGWLVGPLVEVQERCTPKECSQRTASPQVGVRRKRRGRLIVRTGWVRRRVRLIGRKRRSIGWRRIAQRRRLSRLIGGQPTRGCEGCGGGSSWPVQMCRTGALVPRRRLRIAFAPGVPA